jgi:hypothetical protein
MSRFAIVYLVDCESIRCLVSTGSKQPFPFAGSVSADPRAPSGALNPSLPSCRFSLEEIYQEAFDKRTSRGLVDGGAAEREEWTCSSR